ncbi:MAG: TerB family tellurite resistance protein [Deltaproteobacteria bacterium]|nr:MAG: TerB family tellurite resistance protein [Deltaproteobacteria bacterium]
MENIKAMNATTKRRLMQLACVAAWSNMEVVDAERDAVLAIAHDIDLGEGDLELVKRWLREGPPDFDPYDVPHTHRKAFLEVFTRVVAADGRIDPEESEAIRLIRELVS